MMKKIVAFLLILVLTFSLVACGGEESTSGKLNYDTQNNGIQSNGTQNNGTQNNGTQNNDTNQSEQSDPSGGNASFRVNSEGVETLDDLEIRIDEQLGASIESLNTRWQTLSTEIDSYEKYCKNSEKISAFYQTIITETEQMCIMLYEYSAVYARMILDSDMSNGDKYDAADGINDCLYKDACDEINDEIYGGILEELNEHFYKGILDKAKNEVDYSKWYDVYSKEYEQWYDTSSEVYSLYYDTASDIYSFYYDMSSKLFSGDTERAEKVYAKFLEKINKMKGLDTGTAITDATFDTTLRNAGSVEELETVVEAHVSECVQAIQMEWETLSKDIDSYDKYTDNVAVIKEFHTHIEDSASQIFVMICQYGVSYADLIMQSDSDAKEKYKKFDDFKDCIYEDACAFVKDDIYGDLLGKIKDYYYDGIIKDAKDAVEYSSWSDSRGDAYSWWSDSRGEVYENWSDTRSELYSFYSEIRGELYSKDNDGANRELQDFKDKVTKMN